MNFVEIELLSGVFLLLKGLLWVFLPDFWRQKVEKTATRITNPNIRLEAFCWSAKAITLFSVDLIIVFTPIFNSFFSGLILFGLADVFLFWCSPWLWWQANRPFAQLENVKLRQLGIFMLATATIMISIFLLTIEMDELTAIIFYGISIFLIAIVWLTIALLPDVEELGVMGFFWFLVMLGLMWTVFSFSQLWRSFSIGMNLAIALVGAGRILIPQFWHAHLCKQNSANLRHIGVFLYTTAVIITLIVFWRLL